MCGCGCDQYNLVPGKQTADAVNDGDILQRPSRARLGLNPFQLGLCHAGVMFQRHGGYTIIAAQPAHRAHKKRNAANRVGLQGAAFCTNIKIIRLHPYRHHLPPGNWREKGHLVAG